MDSTRLTCRRSVLRLLRRHISRCGMSSVCPARTLQCLSATSSTVDCCSPAPTLYKAKRKSHSAEHRRFRRNSKAAKMALAACHKPLHSMMRYVLELGFMQLLGAACTFGPFLDLFLPSISVRNYCCRRAAHKAPRLSPNPRYIGVVRPTTSVLILTPCRQLVGISWHGGRSYRVRISLALARDRALSTGKASAYVWSSAGYPADVEYCCTRYESSARGRGYAISSFSF